MLANCRYVMLILICGFRDEDKLLSNLPRLNYSNQFLQMTKTTETLTVAFEEN